MKIFISYAHEDELFKTNIEKHLIGLIRSDSVSVWNDHELLPGQEWNSTISQEVEEADIILLLISVDFNNSRYIWENELVKAIDRHEKGTARVIPIIVRTCDWQEMSYAKLQALPKGGVPIATFVHADEAYTQIAKEIRKLVAYLTGQ